MDEPHRERPIVVDSDGMIAEDVACHVCGCNINGWPPEGPCPRCGEKLDLLRAVRLERKSLPPRPMVEVQAVKEPAQYVCAGCGARFGTTGDIDLCLSCGLPLCAAIGRGESSTTVDEHGVLSADVLCRKCGYNLRGLRRDGLCPECAAPISVSTQQNLLCFAEPGYVRKLARGIRWAVRGLTLTMLSFVFSIIGIAAGTLIIARAPLPNWIAGAGMLIGALGYLGGALLFLLGVWLLTTAELGVFRTRPQHRSRRMVRVFILASVGGVVLGYAVDVLVPPLGVMAIFVLVSQGFYVLGVIAVVAYFRQFRAIAKRVPDRFAIDRARSIGRILAIAVGVLVFFGIVDAITHWVPVLAVPARGPVASAPVSDPARLGSAWGTTRSCASKVADLAIFVLFFGAVRLHTRLAKPLEQQAALAAKHWDAATAPESR